MRRCLCGICGEKLRRLGIFFLLAQIFDANEQIGRIVVPRGIDSGDKRCGIGGLVRNGHPGLVERLRLAEIAEARGLCQCGRDRAGISMRRL